MQQQKFDNNIDNIDKLSCRQVNINALFKDRPFLFS